MTITPIETRFDGYLFRSRTEARWAVFFKSAGIRYEYEKEGYALPTGWYLPDFFLPDLGFWFEVKGTNPTPSEIMLILELHKATGNPSLLAVGAPTPEDQIIYPGHWILPSDGLADIVFERYYFCDDRKSQGALWLLSDAVGCGSSFCPVRGKDPDKYPSIAAAYQAARSARFERGGR